MHGGECLQLPRVCLAARTSLIRYSVRQIYRRGTIPIKNILSLFRKILNRWIIDWTNRAKSFRARPRYPRSRRNLSSFWLTSNLVFNSLSLPIVVIPRVKFYLLALLTRNIAQHIVVRSIFNTALEFCKYLYFCKWLLMRVKWYRYGNTVYYSDEIIFLWCESQVYIKML
jgi:hypothetical protein